MAPIVPPKQNGRPRKAARSKNCRTSLTQNETVESAEQVVVPASQTL